MQSFKPSYNVGDFDLGALQRFPLVILCIFGVVSWDLSWSISDTYYGASKNREESVCHGKHH